MRTAAQLTRELSDTLAAKRKRLAALKRRFGRTVRLSKRYDIECMIEDARSEVEIAMRKLHAHQNRPIAPLGAWRENA